MLCLSMPTLSELFPKGWEQLWIARELPFQQYEATAVFFILALAGLAVYINTARAQLRVSRADSETRPAQHAALVQASKRDTSRIMLLTTILMVHAALNFFFDFCLAIYINYKADKTTATSPDAESIDAEGWAIIAFAIVLGCLMAIPLCIVVFGLIPLGQVGLFSWSLARYARKHGHEALDGLIPSCRILAAHMGLVWTAFCYFLTSYLPLVHSNATLVVYFPWVFQICIYSCSAWWDVAKRLLAVESNLADIEFCKDMLNLSYIRWAFGKRSLAVNNLLGEDCPPQSVATVDEKTEMLIEV